MNDDMLASIRRWGRATLDMHGQQQVDALLAEIGRERAARSLAEARLTADALRITELKKDKARLDWWFAHGLDDSVCDGSVDVWWADDEAEAERITHGTSIRDALDKAMQGIHEPGGS